MKWLKEPGRKEYAAAKTYLSLLFDAKTAGRLVKKLKSAGSSEYDARDVLRAARLPLLPAGESIVKKEREKILADKKISPLLLVRHSSTAQTIVADGYHRLCAICSIDEDAAMRCKIV